MELFELMGNLMEIWRDRLNLMEHLMERARGADAAGGATKAPRRE
jgi:hypothetical protein